MRLTALSIAMFLAAAPALADSSTIPPPGAPATTAPRVMGTGILGGPASPSEIDQAQQYAECMSLADSAPDKALAKAKAWQHKDGGAPAGHCAAVALVGLGRYKEAASAMEKLALEELNQNKDLAAGLYGQAAQAWVLATDNARAIKDETAAIALAPGNPDLLVDRGVILASTGKFWEAVDDFSKAHDMADRRADILVFRATAYRMMKSFDLAQDDLDRAIELQPKNPDAYLERGIVRMLVKDTDGAKADWQKTVDFGPGTPAAQTAEANLKQLVAPPAPAPAAAPQPSATAPATPAAPAQPAPEPPPAQPINPQLPLVPQQ
jgi:tetratricopeptide (TPR) repeat protein